MTALTRKLSAAALALAFATSPALAAEVRDFDGAAFAAAQRAGKPILVNVKAWWCPVCMSQGSTIKAAIKDPAYDRLVVFNLNYDKQKAELPRFEVKRQGTILAYKGMQQVGRLDFVTDKPKIRALIAQTVK